MPSSNRGASSGWSRKSHSRSMPEVHASVPIRGGRFLQRMASFLGPGYLVAVGYMDPGNWATSIAGGSAFGYTLLSVVVLSSLMAVLLQALSLRLGVASGRDLAQACHDAYPAPVSKVLFILAEGAIVATDLAEVIGTAVGLNLLFNIPLQFGVLLTALDVFLILWLQGRGFRRLEAMVFALTMVIAVSFAIEMAYSQPVWGDVLRGFVPQTRIITSPAMLYLALGILGATVMPHNLYLHSAVIQTRKIGPTETDRREAIRMGTIDSTIALMFALLINAAILILAAATFYTRGQTHVAEIQQAYHLMGPALGTPVAAILFAVALLASGLNSTVTATLTGQIIMEGFIHIHLPAWKSRLLTRGLAIIPAAAVTMLYGESGIARLLVLSQVILSLQLPFAIVPLVMFTANRKKMSGLPAPLWMTALAWLIGSLVIVLNLKLLWNFSTGGTPF